jgi:hypothetical protein
MRRSGRFAQLLPKNRHRDWNATAVRHFRGRRFIYRSQRDQHERGFATGQQFQFTSSSSGMNLTWVEFFSIP